MFNQVLHLLLLPGRSLLAASIATSAGAVVGEKNDYLQGPSSGADLGRKSKRSQTLMEARQLFPWVAQRVAEWDVLVSMSGNWEKRRFETSG